MGTLPASPNAKLVSRRSWTPGIQKNLRSRLQQAKTISASKKPPIPKHFESGPRKHWPRASPHNFNNILMGIQGRASLMIMDKDPSHPDYKHLNGIEESVRSAAELTRDLLGFARGGKYEPKPTDLNTLIKHEKMMFGRTKKEIQVHGNYNKDL